MDSLYILLISVIGTLGAITAYLLWSQLQTFQTVRDLSELRQNALDDQRAALKEKTCFQLEVAKELAETIQAVQRFYHHYERIKAVPAHEQEILACELRKQQAINDDLTEELSKMLNKNDLFEEQTIAMRQQEHRIEDLLSHNAELRGQLQKVNARNEELEYAINLESVSMIEDYDSHDKLYTAIDDVRRSLTRILNSA
jgi:ribosome-associated translation inhibitor RaiA